VLPSLLYYYYLAGTACATLAAGGLWAGPLGWAGAGMGCVAGLAFSSLAKEVVHQYFRAPELYPRQCGVRLHKFARGAQLAEVEEWESNPTPTPNPNASPSPHPKPKPSPSPCPNATPNLTQVEEWEFRVAAELQRDPGAVIVVDDVARLSDASAFEHFGRLLCGGGGNSIPEFRTGRDNEGPTLTLTPTRTLILTPTLTLSLTLTLTLILALTPTRRDNEGERVAASEALFVLTSDLELEPSEPQLSCEVRSLAY
jgi:hypothetical protein